MDAKEATQIAVRYVAELFANEAIGDLGLEEVEYDGNAGEWAVTVGFSRP